MTQSATFLKASQAAERLGVTIKALRLYEKRGLLIPRRTAAGHRAYGLEEMRQAAEIVGLRSLGFSLVQIAGVLEDPLQFESALDLQAANLREQIVKLTALAEKIRGIRAGVARGRISSSAERAACINLSVAFALPWPWGGERFELRDVHALNFITGPLGCGKTRLALGLAESIHGAAFLSCERVNEAAVVRARLEANTALKRRVDPTLTWLVDRGATPSESLTALLVGLEAEGPSALVVDMVEQGLDRVSQEALMVHLRLRAAAGARPLFLMTRSAAILDLTRVGPDESIIYCPANHSPPFLVSPYMGAPGFEALSSCLATPEVRARIARCPIAA